jgi:hypothetical protein
MLEGALHAVEVVGDELEVSEANGFVEGESSTRQVLAIGGNSD